jgi:hypothetical protein
MSSFLTSKWNPGYASTVIILKGDDKVFNEEPVKYIQNSKKKVKSRTRVQKEEQMMFERHEVHCRVLPDFCFSECLEMHSSLNSMATSTSEVQTHSEYEIVL